MRSVVITGASTGIGWASAKLLLDKGFRVFGSVRKQADAERLKNEFGANFTPLLFDVTDEAAVLAAAREVRAALNGETLAGLVNNAGIAVTGPVLELSADDFRRQMDVNVIGPIIATQAFGPLRCPDPAASQGALPDCPRSIAAPDDGVAAQAHGRQDHRQASRTAAAGVSRVRAARARDVLAPWPGTSWLRAGGHVLPWSLQSSSG
jgi:NAD(P)-dependent dehydrogenase (short-subunit alcohol dehydrogenase family)